MSDHKRTLVTCALPYANGPVHIGHLAGAYIPGDIYVRYLRMRGEDVVFVCGSDEHGVPITIKARAQGVTPQDIVDKYHQVMKDAFTGLGINFDIYSRTTPLRPSFSGSCTTTISSSRRRPNSITTRRRRPSLRTATSWVPAPSAVIPAPMATSARNAAPR